MADDDPTDTDTGTSTNGLRGMSRVTLMLHEGILRGLGVLLESYKTWLRSHRTPANRPPNGNGNGNGSRRANGNGN